MNYALTSGLGQALTAQKLYQDVTDAALLTNYFRNASRKALNSPEGSSSKQTENGSHKEEKRP
jgi:hypothetical protein